MRAEWGRIRVLQDLKVRAHDRAQITQCYVYVPGILYYYFGVRVGQGKDDVKRERAVESGATLNLRCGL